MNFIDQFLVSCYTKCNLDWLMCSRTTNNPYQYPNLATSAI